MEQLLWDRPQTKPEVVEEYLRLAGQHGEDATMSVRHLSRLASGKRGDAKSSNEDDDEFKKLATNPVTRRVLQLMFGHPLEVLLAKPGDALPVAAPGSASGLLLPMGQPPADRELIRMAAERSKSFLNAARPNLTTSVMDQIHADVQALATDYPQRPLSELLPDLIAAQDMIFSLVEDPRQPAQARQLYWLAGVASGLLAKASHDLADPRAAMTQARTAYLCAERADHAGLQAWIRGIQSLVSYWAGRPRDSVRYAQDGAALGATNTSSVWLAANEARARAALGDIDGTRAAITRAETAWDTVREDEVDELGGLCQFGQVRTIYYAAEASSWLPSQSAATQEYALRAVEAYQDREGPEWAFGDEAGARSALAVARVQAGEVEGAAEALAPVLSLPPGQRINGIVRATKQVHRALRDSPQAAGGTSLQEEIEVFSRLPLQLPR
ncbi:hypothetical protein ACN20G_36810 (plasmid) [Streptomyces sp. BI20]|uniref:hypothetical protein n=1 Tax=Streptomyces sp. BI20 TaxID=3403460 RepID=UPI003C76EB89